MFRFCFIDASLGAYTTVILCCPGNKRIAPPGLVAPCIFLQRSRRVIGWVHTDRENENIPPQTITKVLLNTRKMSGGHRAKGAAGGEHEADHHHLALEHVVVKAD